VKRIVVADAGPLIQLALEKNANILIIDDRRGRKIAKNRDIRIIGTGGILIAAKRKNILDEVAPILDNLAGVGYRLAPDLCRRILELADEG
jgi:predicted nucleic acid-binding protein